MCDDALQKLQEGSELQTGPLEVESADDFLRATALRHRCETSSTSCCYLHVDSSLTALSLCMAFSSPHEDILNRAFPVCEGWAELACLSLLHLRGLQASEYAKQE